MPLSEKYLYFLLSPLCQFAVPLGVPPRCLEAELSQLSTPLHPFTLQTPHVGAEDAAETKVLQRLLSHSWQMIKNLFESFICKHLHLKIWAIYSLINVLYRLRQVYFKERSHFKHLTSTIPTCRVTSGRVE